ncbi:MAG: serine/threonine protein kinase [Planctomycetota bacterium]|nr:MAG: serine/threonine protein kinase [Planctomycetota bacterium]
MGAGLLDPEFMIGASLADDRFKIVARVGTGSMAFVYRAFDRRLETDVVVKVPKKYKLEDVGLRERFSRESRLLVQLQHPHIVNILDVGMHSNVPFVVMQYLSGGCLRGRMESSDGQSTALAVDSIRAWLLEIAKALDFAHRRNVVHRDVKPANILFDESGNAFLADFGLTKIMHGEMGENAADETAAGYVVGTPNYVAPEIVLGAEYDGRADQYSLGITMFHTLIGTPPMLGKTPSATMVNQTRRILPLISALRKEVPVAVAQALAKAISKKPEARFATCLEFAEAAIAGLSGTQATVRPPHETKRPPKQLADSSVKAQAGSSVRAQTDSSVKVQAGSSVRAQADSSVKPQADSSVKAQADSSVKAQADSSVKAQADSSSKSQADSTGVTRKRQVLPLRLSNSPRKSINAKRVSYAKSMGVINCPQCREELRLRPEDAGRSGRCMKCATRLQIGTDLLTLTEISARTESADSPAIILDDDDLIIGEKVFGVTLGRKAMIGLGTVLVVVVVTAAAIFFQQLMKPELERQQREQRQLNLNREND